jgi:hypothetical protein
MSILAVNCLLVVVLLEEGRKNPAHGAGFEIGCEASRRQFLTDKVRSTSDRSASACSD